MFDLTSAELRWARSLGVGLLMALSLGGCPKRGTSTVKPEEVLRAYAQAVRGAKYARAYELMAESYRKNHPKADFIKALEQNPKEAKRTAEQASSKVQKVEIQAIYQLGNGEALELVVEKGKWRISGDPIDFYSQRTPRLALRSFVRAIRGRRYEVVLRFVPAKWAKAMTIEKLKKLWEGEKRAEVEEMLKQLEASIKAPIQMRGDRAEMPYGTDKKVTFVKEDGRWKIEDPD